MRDILDPGFRWIGTPQGAQVAGNKRPITVDDTLVILKDSGPVSVDVLVNDFDPEGATLSLISAVAALGTAVAETDNTVTYTPPPGLSGFDTVTYEIADDVDQRRVGQVNVTITEPQLSVDTDPDNTLSINAETGILDITVTEPALFAGSWSIDTNDLAGGPVSLVAPAITGTAEVGESLSADGGLWVYDSGAGQPQQSWQWQRGGQVIAGETGANYTVTGADLGPGISVTETQTDAYGQRSAESAVVGAGFLPSNDGNLLGWWDASDNTTITESNGFVSAWADKAGGPSLTQAGSSWRPVTGARVLNGQNVLEFSSGQSWLEANRSFPASGNVAFHAALVIDSTASSFAALLAVEATNDFQLDAASNTQFDGRLNAAGIGSTTPLTGGPFVGGIILSLVFDKSGASEARVFFANTSRASMGYSTPIDSTAALHLMTNRSKNAWIDGAVAELVITEDVTNRGDYHAYLASKWGLS